MSPKRQQDEIIERNIKERDRILNILESEGIAEKKVGEILQEFSKNGFPLVLEEILRMIAPLKTRYGLPKMGSSVYPEPPSPIIPPSWQKLGMRYFFEFSNGQFISVVIANDGQTVIKRSYEDNGDIHLAEVIRTLKAWQKGIEQKQKGGRKNDPELFGLFQEWQEVKLDPQQKAVFRKRYIDNHSENPLAHDDFDQAMKRYKRKLREQNRL